MFPPHATLAQIPTRKCSSRCCTFCPFCAVAIAANRPFLVSDGKPRAQALYRTHVASLCNTLRSTRPHEEQFRFANASQCDLTEPLLSRSAPESERTIAQRPFEMSRSYAFIEFRSTRDAEDAYYDM